MSQSTWLIIQQVIVKLSEIGEAVIAGEISLSCRRSADRRRELHEWCLEDVLSAGDGGRWSGQVSGYGGSVADQRTCQVHQAACATRPPRHTTSSPSYTSHFFSPRIHYSTFQTWLAASTHCCGMGRQVHQAACERCVLKRNE